VLKDVYINRIGAYLPNSPVSNEQMETLLGRVGQRPSRARALILKSSGIRSRHYAIDAATGSRTHTNAQMTANAIRKLLEEHPESDAVECLACGTSTPDQLLPSHAVMVHGELRIPPCEIASITGICVSGVQALKYGYMSVRSRQTRNAVCCGSELASPLIRGRLFESEPRVEGLRRQPTLAFEKDFLRWMLSDGAGAVLLQDRPNSRGPSLRIEWIDVHSFAGELPACMYQGAAKNDDGTLAGYLDHAPEDWINQSIMSVKQDVKLLNAHVVSVCVQALERTVKRRNLATDRIDYFLPHLSSEHFREKLHEAYLGVGHGIPQSKWFTNLSSVGNVGSASIYLILEELFHSGKLRPGDTLLLMIPESGRFTMSYALLTVVGQASAAS